MGWDAYATREGRGLDRVTDAEALGAFRAAAAEVAARAGAVDCQLEGGRLDTWLCRVYIERATGHLAGNVGWRAEELRERVRAAAWPEEWEVGEGEEWAALSARRFLEVCARYGLGAQFC